MRACVRVRACTTDHPIRPIFQARAERVKPTSTFRIRRRCDRWVTYCLVNQRTRGRSSKPYAGEAVDGMGWVGG